VQPDDRVLDIGCGTGDTTRRAATHAVDGTAFGVDLSSVMLARARERAEEAGLANIRFEQADAQVHPFEPAAHDLVISRFGVMFFDDPARAFANIAAATRPGGRLAVLAWQPVAGNDWVEVPIMALERGRDRPPLPENAPGPFGLADPDRARALLTAAGWSDVDLADVRVPFCFGPDLETAVSFASDIGVVRGSFEGLDESEAQEAIASLRDSLARHATDDGVFLDSRTWVITAVR
jgi:SAM-dependent methyltransferase